MGTENLGPIGPLLREGDAVPKGGYVPLSASKVYSLWVEAVAKGTSATFWEDLDHEEREQWMGFARLLRDYIRE